MVVVFNHYEGVEIGSMIIMGWEELLVSCYVIQLNGRYFGVLICIIVFFVAKSLQGFALEAARLSFCKRMGRDGFLHNRQPAW